MMEMVGAEIPPSHFCTLNKPAKHVQNHTGGPEAERLPFLDLSHPVYKASTLLTNGEEIRHGFPQIRMSNNTQKNDKAAR